MSPIARALTTLTVLILFVATPLSSVMAQVRPPLPPGLKGKDLEKLRRQVNNNNDKRKQEYEKKKEEEERYHVVQIGLKFEVVQQKNLGSLKKSAPKKYKAQVAKYEKARKAAEKKGREIKEARPPSTVFKILSDKGYKTQKEARANAQRLQRKVASKRKQ